MYLHSSGRLIDLRIFYGTVYYVEILQNRCDLIEKAWFALGRFHDFVFCTEYLIIISAWTISIRRAINKHDQNN